MWKKIKVFLETNLIDIIVKVGTFAIVAKFFIDILLTILEGM